MDAQKRAGIYARISRDDGQRLGVKRQQADCEALVERRGWTIVGVYVDNDVSAFSARVRPEYQRLIEDVKQGVVDAIVAWHPDRLHRSPRNLEDFIDLIEATGAQVATCTAGDYDLSTPDGRLMARIVGSVARKESEDKSRRLRRKHEELAAAGKSNGSGRSFGYLDHDTIHQAEATRIIEAARRVLAGDSLYRITLDWTAEDVPTVRGAPWSTTALKTALLHARLAGLREHRGVIVGPSTTPAILEETTWRRVRAVLTDPARGRRPVPRTYLLTGMLRCALCGSPLKATPRSAAKGIPGASVRAYGCVARDGGCGHVFGLASKIEGQVVADLLDELDQSGLARWRKAHCAGPPDRGPDLAADEARLAELADLWGDGAISRAEWLRARARIESRLDDLRRQVARTAVDPLNGIEDLAESWPALSLDRKRAVLGAVLDRVTLAPATGVRNRWNPARVAVEWR